MLGLQTLAACLALMPAVYAAAIVDTSDSVSAADIATVSAKSKSCGSTIQSTCACTVLGALLSGSVFLPGTANYTAESTYYWDKREALAPKCVFVPASTKNLALGVLVLQTCQSPFAIRGGGHMPVKGAANIDGGVLVAMTKFNTVTVASDKKTVDTGSGNGWFAVYSALDKYGLYCVGGRLKSIGVAGLTLGGGINYLAAKYGFAMDGVTAYEVVLASGKVVSASATSNPDLFWALKGGGNNFGIVTKFTLKTYAIPSVGTGLLAFPATQIPAFISAITSQALYQQNYDLAAGTIPTLGYSPSTTMEESMLFTFAVGNTATPPVFANYTAIPNLYAIQNVGTPASFHSQFDTPYQQQRIMFNTHSVAPDAANIQTMWNTMKADSAELKSVPGFTLGVTLQPITKSTTAVAANNGIGNAVGTDSSKAYIWWALNVYWSNAADDAAVIAWAKKTTEKIHSANTAKGLASNEIYMGDAGDWQDVIGSYPKANIAKLKTVRAKYDPNQVFRKLVTGGFKLAA